MLKNDPTTGIVYEPCTPDPDDAVIIQGLTSRCTGYDDTGNNIVLLLNACYCIRYNYAASKLRIFILSTFTCFAKSYIKLIYESLD